MKTVLFVSCFEEWYKNRLEPIVNCFSAADNNVLCVVSDYNHIKKTYSHKMNKKCTYIHVPQYGSNISVRRIVSHLIFGQKIKKLIREMHPDLLYLVVPPNNAAKYCMKYKKNQPGTKLILDIIDLWPESMPLGRLKNTLPANVWRKWRDKSIEIADHVFTECDLYQEKLKLSPERTSTLYLFKEQSAEERELVQKIIENRKSSGSIIKFAYLGSMNHIIDIDSICSVIMEFMAAGYGCELHAIGCGENKERFEALAQRIGCSTYFYGAVFDEKKKIKILAPCDYAFNMMKGEISVGLTIKSMDYLSYGLPIINNIKGDTWKLVEEENVGLNADAANPFVMPTQIINHADVVKVFQDRFEKESFKQNARKVLMELGIIHG